MSQRRYFGTDGIRGVANEGLTPDLAFRLGIAAGRWLRDTNRPPTAFLGRDTRQSGPMLGAAMAAGLCSAGISVTAGGVAPTPLVSFATREGGFGLGVVISASHNPFPDNGIKLLGTSGAKLSDDDELAIEAYLDEPYVDRPTGGDVGWLETNIEWNDRYLDFLTTLVPLGLKEMRVALDAANGAAYRLGRQALERLGAEVVAIHETPNGTNINVKCGATHPSVIRELTLEQQTEVGVAFDGDADRAVFSDDEGYLINGDRMMAAWAAHRRPEPRLVVGTVMSNQGLDHFLRDIGYTLERAKVGDKYVSERLAATGAQIGGEQSGHIILPKNGPTGDGLATMLEFLSVLRESGRKASEWREDIVFFPQLLANVKVDQKEGWEDRDEIQLARATAESMVGSDGRVLVRASGTQPKLRVMVEARDAQVCAAATNLIVQALVDTLGGRETDRTDLAVDLGE